jgi:hypothetical protein
MRTCLAIAGRTLHNPRPGYFCGRDRSAAFPASAARDRWGA